MSKNTSAYKPGDFYDNNFYISVEGISDTLVGISKFDFNLHDDIKKVIKNYAKKIQAKAKAIVPVKSGNLRKAISVKYYRQGMAAHIYPSDEKIRKGMASTGKRQSYRHFVEYGTMDRHTKYIHPIYGTFRGHMKAYRYMGSARMAYQNSFEQEISKILNKKVVV